MKDGMETQNGTDWKTIGNGCRLCRGAVGTPNQCVSALQPPAHGKQLRRICMANLPPQGVISRNGRHYYNLKLMPGFGSRSMHDDVTEFVMDVLCTEASRIEEGSE